jgi:hypothetical protein
MRADLLFRERVDLSETEFVELVAWRVDPAVKASRHSYKYRLAFIADGDCVLRYDNEGGKGDHKHVDGREQSYTFVSIRKLRVDFWNDVVTWREKQ